MGEVVPIRPRERVELPPPPPPARKLGERFPWRVTAALLIPTAALAAATGIQRWAEGSLPIGDALGRWLLIASVSGGIAGTASGPLLGRALAGRLAWLAWGTGSPWLLVLASLGITQVVRPLRDSLAARQERACHEQGRPACSLLDFTRGCRAAAAGAGSRERARNLLGSPALELCDGGGCTQRFRYEGPWTPDNWVAPGALVCSVVSDASGRGLRFALLPGDPPK